MDIHTILFATDFSEASDPAFRVAASLARDNSARLVLLHVSEYDDYPMGEQVDEEPTPPQNETDKLNALISRVQGVRCEWRWVHREQPHQADAIIEVAENEDADIVVVGSHGRRGLMHLLMGSVAEKVIRDAKCPVLCVRHMKLSTDKV